MAIATPSKIDDELRSLAENALRGTTSQTNSNQALVKLRELGTELWLDTGNLEEARSLWTPEFTALTTNNTLANQVVQTGIMDEVAQNTIRELRAANPSISENDLVVELGFVINCHIALRLVKAFGAMVSVELHPAVSENIDRTVYFAERYFAVCPERFYIKIPLTPEGYCSVARVRAKGIPVNYTLGFGARQNYVAAIVSNPTFCNVFLGRLNAVVADNRLGDGKFVGEKAAHATQMAIRELRSSGLTQTKMIAASMRAPSQVADLAGADVFTIPPKVAREFIASSPDPAGLTSLTWRSFDVQLAPGVDPKITNVLWNVDENIRALASDLKSRGPLTLTGDDLRAADKDHRCGLFYRFSQTEIEDIKEQGKIPNLERWKSVPQVALDTLMTESALQSFAVDQEALDTHLRSIVRAN